MALFNQFIRIKKKVKDSTTGFDSYSSFRNSSSWDVNYLKSIIFDENSGIIYQNDIAYGSDTQAASGIVDLLIGGTLISGGSAITVSSSDLKDDSSLQIFTIKLELDEDTIILDAMVSYLRILRFSLRMARFSFSQTRQTLNL